MESLFNMIEKAAYVVIFCLSVMLLYWQFTNFNIFLNVCKENVFDDFAIYKQRNYQESEDIVTYDEIIIGLINSIDYDVQINELYISKNTFNYTNFDYLNIPKYNKYRRDVVYNQYGVISLIRFTGIL